MVQCHHRIGVRLDSAIVIVLITLAPVLLPAERASAQPVPPTCPPQLGSADLIDNDLNVSFCKPCDLGTVRIVVENPIHISEWTNSRPESTRSTDGVAGASP
jgi:hypothetical protein